MREITVHALLPHQEPAGVSPARFKVLRWGRRTGKDAFAENVSLLGHGPEEGGVPKWKGLVHGFDIVWLAPTIPQASAMWKNEVEPRFRHHQGIELNRVEKTVTILNPDGTAYATLWVRSAEAIDSIRGIGKKLGGVVINEAAWMDLETAWRDVIRPTLMDCGGWAAIMSTTNGGPDGHIDEGGTKRSPSFYNIVCEQIQQGQRGPEWEEFYGTARENPRISPVEFDSLVLEYPADSVTLQQEVYAKLVVGGAGVAFPEWNDDVHIARYSPEDVDQRHNFRWACGGDWGYSKPGGLWLIATGSERSLCRHEFYFTKRTPYDVGYSWGKQIQRFPKPEWISIDTPAVADGGPDILEQLQAGMNAAVKKNPPVFVNPPKGAGSRATKKTMLHEALKWKADADGKVNPWDMPALQFHPDCPNMIRTLQKIPRDPKKPEDVDTAAEDHPYDGICAWAMARTPYVDRPQPNGHHPDDHPGMSKRYELEPVEIGDAEVKWSRLPPGYEEEWGA